LALEEGRALLRCQQRILRTAARYARARHQALSRCFEKALRCPSVLSSGGTASDDRCLAAVGARCNRLVGKSARKALLVERAGPACTLGRSERLRISNAALFEDEGLGFSLLAPLCPGVAVSEANAESGSTCQQRALTCGIDTAVARSLPRAAELLTRIGFPSSVEGHCLMASLCGNGVLDGEEECDVGVENSDTEPDSCRTTCLDPYCGDGVVDDDEGEDCDDGNHRNGDGCDEDCFVEDPDGARCGDGIVADDEECDAGAGNSDTLPNACRPDCTEPECGDGVIDPAYDELCEPPGTMLCDEFCEPQLPLGMRTDRPTDPVAQCQLAITTAGRRLFGQTRTGVGGCVGHLARCLLGYSEAQDPDGDKSDACVEQADRRCLRIAEKLRTARARLTGQVATQCAGTSLGALLDQTSGLGFGEIATSCPVSAGTAPSVGDLVRCALDNVRCGAESTIAAGVPRAYELLTELVEVDADESFPCVRDPDDLE
jgi:cysteine-rich repeat protein